MTNGIIKAVDFRMQELARMVNPDKTTTVQMTVRIPETLKTKLDVISSFMSGTRNSLLVEFLEIACDEAIARIEDNPYMSGFLVNGLSISETLKRGGHTDIAGLDDYLHEIDIGSNSARNSSSAKS